MADMTTSIALSTAARGSYAPGYVGRGLLHHDKGDFERALADFDAALEVSPSDGAALYGRGMAQARAGRLDRAVADLTAFIDLDARGAVSPSDPLAPAPGVKFESRGLVHLRLGSFAAALSDYEAALKVDPRLAGSLYGRGIA